MKVAPVCVERKDGSYKNLSHYELIPVLPIFPKGLNIYKIT